MTYRRKFIVITMGCILFAAASIALYPRIETARLWYDVVGIDVSHHQGRIDWPSVAAGGTAFAYVKATEGGTFVDPSFAENWRGARAAGLPTGAYHFFTLCKSGSDQAVNYIATVPKVAGSLPPAIDAEHMGPCTGASASHDPAHEITVLLEALAAHYGCQPIIYTTRGFERTFLWGHFDNENLLATQHCCSAILSARGVALLAVSRGRVEAWDFKGRWISMLFAAVRSNSSCFS